ncbi:unnamed protein product [marine sediment metagenome]|uniref:Uncharacterized protein n=1 Tax=marine sediment metagenome TaxID=412755 RepID=X0XNL3_9ZZZZ
MGVFELSYAEWSKKELNYDFNSVFVLVSVIYLVCTFYDFSLTYITFRLSPDGFFKYELSFVIKEALSGSPLFCMLIVLFVFSPLIIVYGLNAYLVHVYGRSVNEIRVCFFSLYVLSIIHIYGGLTNLVYIVNL